MRRSVLTGVALIGALAGSPAFADDARPDPVKTLADAAQAWRDGDCPKAVSLASIVMDKQSAASADDVSRAYDLVIDCAWQAKDFTKAVDYAQREMALPASSDFSWRIPVAADFNAGRFASAVDRIEHMLAAGRGGTLNSIDPRLLVQLHVRLERGGDAANDTRLLAILANPAYDPDDIVAKIDDTGDYLRALYARKLIAAGKRDEARAMLADLKGYNAMVEVAFDPALLALRGKPVDFRAVVEADLVRHRAMIETYPKSLAAINAVAHDLTMLGRADEAIVLLKGAVTRAAVADTFDDQQERLRWTWDALADAYTVTGKYDETIDAYNHSTQGQGDKPLDVDQAINLASRQYGFGHAADALAALDRMGEKPDLSPYGAALIRKIRGCSYAVLGQLDKARTVLAEALAHERDAPPVITELELCVGDENAAAASLIRRLANPESRREAMQAVADYDNSDPRTPKSPFHAAYDRMIKRPDVVSAMRAAGGQVRIHLPA